MRKREEGGERIELHTIKQNKTTTTTDCREVEAGGSKLGYMRPCLNRKRKKKRWREEKPRVGMKGQRDVSAS